MKRIVHYDAALTPIVMRGFRAIVRPLDHPGPHVSNTRAIITTRVVKVLPEGAFETENSIYKPRYLS